MVRAAIFRFQPDRNFGKFSGTTGWLLFLFLAAFYISPASASQPAAPFAGIGVLLIPESTDFTAPPGSDPLIIYETPGIKRVTEKKHIDLPGISSAIGVSKGEIAIAVMEKKGDWLEISYDDAGRRGWIRKNSFWKYIPWHVYLRGCSAVMLTGLRESQYLLRKGASESSDSLQTLSPGEDMQILDIDGDWADVMVKGPETGWIRWRGGDERFRITLMRCR